MNIMKKTLGILCVGFLCFFTVIIDAKALTIESTPLPETVKRKNGYSFKHYSGDEAKSQIINVKSDDSTYQLYCSDATNVTINDGDTLKLGDKMPYGIAYILLNSYPTKNLISGVTASDIQEQATFCGQADEMMNVWITQSAIWAYQGTISYEKPVSPSLEFTNVGMADSSGGQSCDQIKYSGSDLTGYILWNSYVNNLVRSAKTVQDPSNTDLNVTVDNKWTHKDGVYTSSLISVAPSNDQVSYSEYEPFLTAPEGVKLYNENGTEVSGTVPAGTRLYVVVPDSVAASGPLIKLAFNTTVSFKQAYQYVDETSKHQPSVLVTTDTSSIAAGIETTLLPDTGFSMSSSIYFVGFIILLCGAGIIYVNIKPKKQTDE